MWRAEIKNPNAQFSAHLTNWAADPQRSCLAWEASHWCLGYSRPRVLSYSRAARRRYPTLRPDLSHLPWHCADQVHIPLNCDSVSQQILTAQRGRRPWWVGGWSQASQHLKKGCSRKAITCSFLDGKPGKWAVATFGGMSMYQEKGFEPRQKVLPSHGLPDSRSDALKSCHSPAGARVLCLLCYPS